MRRRLVTLVQRFRVRFPCATATNLAEFLRLGCVRGARLQSVSNLFSGRIEQAIKYVVNGRRLEATLFNSRFVFQLEDIPPDASKDEVGWGVLRTTTPKSVCINQLLRAGRSR